MNTPLIFFGTPQFAATTLAKLLAAGYEITAVVTQQTLGSPSPVSVVAYSQNIPIIQSLDELTAKLPRLKLDLGIIAAYGKIIPESLIAQFPKGIVNIHFSALPKYRGSAPVPWAILNGEQETAVTIFKLDSGLDTGPILAQHFEPIEPHDTAQSLYNRLGELGSDLLLTILPDYLAGAIPGKQQGTEGVSLAPALTKKDGFLDLKNPPRDLNRRVRAFCPWPKVWTQVIVNGSSRHLILLPENMAQLEGKKPVPLKQLFEGYPELSNQLEKIINS